MMHFIPKKIDQHIYTQYFFLSTKGLCENTIIWDWAKYQERGREDHHHDIITRPTKS